MTLALAMMLASCGGEGVAEAGGPETTVASQAEHELDFSGLPDIGLEDLQTLSPVHFPELVGVELDRALAWGNAVGWEAVHVIDVNEDSDVLWQTAGEPAWKKVTFWHDDEIVVEARTG